MVTLKSGAKTDDVRLDRVPYFDERSNNFNVYSIAPSRELISKEWLVHVYLDQGKEGACTGFGTAHAIAAEPRIGDANSITDSFARSLYYGGQKLDPWPGGDYPGARPKYSGTAGLFVLKFAKSYGIISEYRFSRSLDELLVGVGYISPACIGVNWYQGMYDTDHSGFIHVSGRKTGGHWTLIDRVDIRREAVRIHNSWGRSWGVEGKAWLSFKDLERLLGEDGESAFVIK